MDASWLLRYIAEVADFPRTGMRYRDLAPLLADARAFGTAIDAMTGLLAPARPTLVAAIDARGFILGGAIARQLGVGFVPLRKPGKLPGATIGIDYTLESGSDRLELRANTVPADARVAIVDDVLASGGTLSAAAALLLRAHARPVAAAVLIELGALGGRARAEALLPVHAVLTC